MCERRTMSLGRKISLFCITFIVASIFKSFIGFLCPKFVSTNIIFKDIYFIIFVPDTIPALQQAWCENGLIYRVHDLIMPLSISLLFFVAFYFLGFLYQNHFKKRWRVYVSFCVGMSIILLGIFFIILFLLEAYSIYTFSGRM